MSNRTILVDWHGALTGDSLWTFIQEGGGRRPEARLRAIFSGEDLAHDWMGGLVAPEHVIADLGNNWLNRRLVGDFLAIRLNIACAKIRVKVKLFDAPQSLMPQEVIVLVADNIVWFARNFGATRRRHRHWMPESQTLADRAIIGNDITCSREVGALKAEDPNVFVVGWFTYRDLRFSVLVIDDRAGDCEAFDSQDGSIVQWRMGKNNIGEVTELVGQWHDQSIPNTRRPAPYPEIRPERVFAAQS